MRKMRLKRIYQQLQIHVLVLILIVFEIRRKKKYLWFRFHIVKKLGSVGRK